MHPWDISIENFDYSLPEEKIALYPLENRDESKLLIFQESAISEDIYKNIAAHIPEGSFLIFNDTKVIKARILFTTPTGAHIEIFCLEPQEAVKDYAWVLQSHGPLIWKCLVGRASKWKNFDLKKNLKIGDTEVELCATLIEKQADAFLISFSWTPIAITFAEILEAAGETPLPPYIKRKAEVKDERTYQTIYSAHEGSVAAPTAGLHFTQHIFDTLRNKHIHHDFVTLHVGAGTFKPVKSSTMADHEMHAEWMDVSIEVLQNIRDHLKNGIICVGTTSVRTLESLYWMGLKALKNPEMEIAELMIHQWEVYSDFFDKTISAESAVAALIDYLRKRQLNRLLIATQIIIAPGYKFKMIKGIITNFHQPKSTLLLLVAAMVGDEWKKIYQYALEHNFRFLSYGDGCLIFNGDATV